MKHFNKTKTRKTGKTRTIKTGKTDKNRNIKKYRKNTRKQKLWQMKGCAVCKTHYSRCTCNSKQKGGCAQCITQSGGSITQSGGNGALVGNPWTANISSWPGVSGVTGQSNYYAMNKLPVDLQTRTISETNQITLPKFTGGNKKGGGGLIPTELINLGRGITYGLGSAYNSLNGYAPPVDPLPYKGQLIRN